MQLLEKTNACILTRTVAGWKKEQANLMWTDDNFQEPSGYFH